MGESQLRTDERVAALEAQVAALTARLDRTSPARDVPAEDSARRRPDALTRAAPDAPTRPVPDRAAGRAPDRAAGQATAGVDGLPRSLDRRGLLRRGGAVMVGAAGALALPSLTGPALAAAGSPVLAGATTDAGAPSTVLTGGSAGSPTLVLANGAAGSTAVPTLRLTPTVGARLGPDGATTTAGDLSVGGSLLWFTHDRPGGSATAVVGAVYTSAFANHLQFVTPRRVLDTRRGPATDENGNPDDRGTRLVAGDFDASGRLRAGSALTLDLSGFVTSGAGVFGNLTVVAPVGAGFLSAYPTAPGAARTDGADRPAVSSLGFGRGTSVLANFALVGLGEGDRISIFTTTAAHVLFDVVAFSAAEPFSAGDAGTGPAQRTAFRR